MKSLVIIPVFNEEESIDAVLSELSRHYHGDLLVIDDASSDCSSALLQNYAGCAVKVVRHEQNLGYGASLIEGFQYAQEHGYEVAVTMDCDLQHEPHQVPAFLAGIADCDVLSGSRYLQDLPGDSEAPADRSRINRIITQRINALTGYGITDAFCGFKAYKVNSLRSLQLNETGYAFPLQFWIQAHAHNLRVKELAVPRIYKSMTRSFGAALDDPEMRLGYYNEVIERELARWKTA